MTTLYTEDHEWLQIDGDIVTVGITDFAQSQLGDVVFVELPKIGRALKKAEAANARFKQATATKRLRPPIPTDCGCPSRSTRDLPTRAEKRSHTPAGSVAVAESAPCSAAGRSSRGGPCRSSGCWPRSVSAASRSACSS